MGLSPHVRGNQSRGRGPVGEGGSIPARAGEPPAASTTPSSMRVYPRTCGGTWDSDGDFSDQRGLSPHVRGNLPRGSASLSARGSIPARAGEPCTTCTCNRIVRVYPRTCGGTKNSKVIEDPSRGLSPHVRGNHRLLSGEPLVHGSIPARAGEPRRRTARCSLAGVYPRTCGGTSFTLCAALRRAGLSPHVRGNLGHVHDAHVGTGSIPARAGEPASYPPFISLIWVYPRTCGGTKDRGSSRQPARGLSPHVRGNLWGYLDWIARQRSIPARAGEPQETSTTPTATRVYPRTCGGTILVAVCAVALKGLSPHVRGNRPARGCPFHLVGSIPARAGEPFSNRAPSCTTRVYPRTCGGTRGEAGRGRRSLGSIPARAGEPFVAHGSSSMRWVYPRTCGGTKSASGCRLLTVGLSPHVRGNPGGTVRWPRRGGSIPARAGEPCR